MLTDLMLILLFILIGAECWQRRQQSEIAERLIQRYCQSQKWQVLSIARKSFGIPLILSNLITRQTTFVFEFSDDGITCRESELYLTGLNHPVFRQLDTILTPNEPEASGVVIQMPPRDHLDHPELQDTEDPDSKSDNVIPFSRQNRS